MSDLVTNHPNTCHNISQHLRRARTEIAAAAQLVHAAMASVEGPVIHDGVWLNQIYDLLGEIDPLMRNCSKCSGPLVYGETHSPHDRGCAGDGCRCDNETHPECCWEC